MDTKDPIVEAYLDDLRRALAGLPRAKADEVIAEVRAHVAAALPPDHTEADVRNVIEQLGEPAEIAAATREGTPGAAPRGRRKVAVLAAAIVAIAMIALFAFWVPRSNEQAPSTGPYDFRGAINWVGTRPHACQTVLSNLSVTAVVTSAGQEMGSGPATFALTSGQCWLTWNFPLERAASYQLALIDASGTNPGPTFTANQLEAVNGQMSFEIAQFPNGITL